MRKQMETIFWPQWSSLYYIKYPTEHNLKAGSFQATKSKEGRQNLEVKP